MALAANETIDQSFRTFVRGVPEIAALIGTRFYPLIVPQNPTAPYGRFQRISTQRLSSHSGPSCLAIVRYQIDWVGNLETQSFRGLNVAVEVATVARKALQDFRGWMAATRVDRVILDDERDLVDGDMGLVARSQDYTIWHGEDSTLWLR